MSDARDRGWGDPDEPGYAKKHIITVRAGGVRLNVRTEVAPLFIGFVDELVASGYRLDVDADDWGYNNRDIRGRPGVKSNHAWGLAIDLNSSTNPMTEDGRIHTDMPVDLVRHLAAKWGLEWGGDYSGKRRDPMHFEFVGRRGDEDIYPLEDDMPLTPEEHNMLVDVHTVTVKNIQGVLSTFVQPMLQAIKDAVDDDNVAGGAGQITAADIDAIADEILERQAAGAQAAADQ